MALTMRALLLLILILVVVTGAASADAGLARDVLQEMNRVRTDPQGYVKVLQAYRAKFQGNTYDMDAYTVVETEEGTAAVDEAIQVLKHTKPLPPLAWSADLAVVAAELVQDQGETGQTGHRGRRGSFRDRIDRHGTWKGQVGENIGYGPREARLMVISLLVDDGVVDRGHRDNILNRAFRLAGVACGRHPRFRNQCVMDFASTFSAKGGSGK